MEDEAPGGSRSLLGRYEGGPPLTRRNSGYSGVMPDRIALYRFNIERVSGPNEEALRTRISHTVAHEVAHYFGISDDRLREIGRNWSVTDYSQEDVRAMELALGEAGAASPGATCRSARW